MFIKRLISGIILVLLALFFVISGGKLLLFSTLFISLVGLFEFYRVFGLKKSVLAILSYGVTIIYYLALLFLKQSLMIPLIIAFLLLLLFIYVIRYPFFNINEIAISFFGFFYVPVMLSYIYLTRSSLTNGRYIVWLIFLCSWGCDTCAYSVGVLFGRHKMSPVLSPKKSIEGAFGGVLGSVILTFIYVYIFKSQMGLDIKEVILLSLVSGAGAVFSMVGDLAASAVKRNYNIKDYGKIIPGHGGILDRFDSMIITAPIVYYLSILI